MTTRLDWNTLLNPDRRKSSARIEGDPRSEFERDYDRALFATPVRRLQDKAQVFPLEPHDSIRTRLTHSLEVSGIARTLGFYCSHIVQKNEKKHLKRDISREMEFLCLTCGLIHDIGNPPFGHSGEQAISDWFSKKLHEDDTLRSSLLGEGETNKQSQRFCDLTSFEGNAQTLPKYPTSRAGRRLTNPPPPQGLRLGQTRRARRRQPRNQTTPVLTMPDLQS